jgi:hypothetical protein
MMTPLPHRPEQKMPPALGLQCSMQLTSQSLLQLLLFLPLPRFLQPLLVPQTWQAQQRH